MDKITTTVDSRSSGRQAKTKEVSEQDYHLETDSCKERKETSLLAKMKDVQAIQETSVALQSEVHEQEDKMETQAQREDTHDRYPVTHRSLVHFLPKTESNTTLPLSWSLSYETPHSYYLPSPQFSGITVSTTEQKNPKISIVGHSQSMKSLGANSFIMTKEQSLSVLAPETAVAGEGEDYFLSLFGASNKFAAHSFQPEKTWEHFSMILEDMSQSRSSALGDIKIAEVNAKGLFVKLVNSSLDKELEIGGHILQQNVNGQTVSVYRFLPNILMQARCTVTAVAWYTPIHWKQTWEKIETDTEFDRSSVESLASQRHMFHWPTVISTANGKQDKSKNQMEQVRVFLKREKENPPTLFPNSSPWCHSPNVPAHPYCPLIEPHNTSMAGSNLDREPRPLSSRPDPAQITFSHPASGYCFFVIKYWQFNLIILLNFQRKRKG
ncbi:lamin tail domain-containing protein 1 isoform X1 [Suricata suricatta]|uniref:lamin tail domain-containing protein 1 isoform X1 n=1 Tax=Suricata suricatta TaxID=37032 RepID=UPI0011559A20|nr:lamin tail domain-containing protein 1 isoform X1 [Suricata suricatta]